ncbi:MAG: hypothetical protein PsegKO_11030 [Pseudohongiellaceae bacterium]
MNQYQKINLDYFSTAPVRVEAELLLNHPASLVWPIFQSSDAWETFCKQITKATWTSNPPVARDSTRRVRMEIMGYRSIVSEVFFDWQPVKYQFAFYMREGSCKLISAYGELWDLADNADGTCTVRVRAAFSMKSKVLGFLVRYMPLRSGFMKELKCIENYVDAQKSTG